MSKYQEAKVTHDGWITGHDGRPGIPYWCAWSRPTDRVIEGTQWLINKLNETHKTNTRSTTKGDTPPSKQGE